MSAFGPEAYDREIRDVLALESELAQSIARRVEVTITGEEHARLTAARSISPEVYESYLKGRFAVDTKGGSRADLEESIGFFEEAIERDPTFAPSICRFGKRASCTQHGFYWRSSRVGARKSGERGSKSVGSGSRTCRRARPACCDAPGTLAVDRCRSGIQTRP